MRTFEVHAGEVPTWPGITAAGRVVAEFLGRVRVTGDTDAAVALMTTNLRCHQMNSESPQTIERSPAAYAEHVREMLADFGQFSYVVTELLCEDDFVYVRWEQTGLNQAPAGDGPQGQPLVEVGSAVYRVHDGRIAEYWIQLDRHGLITQLRRLHSTSSVTSAQPI
jgi:predicted ester cyclase